MATTPRRAAQARFQRERRVGLIVGVLRRTDGWVHRGVFLAEGSRLRAGERSLDVHLGIGHRAWSSSVPSPRRANKFGAACSLGALGRTLKRTRGSARSPEETSWCPPLRSRGAATAAGWRDCLKMNSVLMKTTEVVKFLRRAIDEADEDPLSEAEARLYDSIHQAVLAYEDEVKLGEGPHERRCMICEQPLSRCRC